MPCSSTSPFPYSLSRYRTVGGNQIEEIKEATDRIEAKLDSLIITVNDTVECLDKLCGDDGIVVNTQGKLKFKVTL